MVRSGGAGAITALLPARDEAGVIAETIRGLRAQSRPPDVIIVIDDGSSDDTGEIARRLGVRVLRAPGRGGSKGRALNFALEQVDTEVVLTVDADTLLAPDAVERLLAAMDDPAVVAASGLVLPRFFNTVWERARHVEYLLTCLFVKPVESRARGLVVISGCFAAFRTGPLRRYGGWPSRSLAEDMDLTWTFLRNGHEVRHVSDAVCYVIDPPDFTLFVRQLRRWSHGFLQNLRAHWPDVLEQPYLRSIVVVTLCSRLLDFAAIWLVLPLLVLLVHPLFLLLLLMELPLAAAVLVPIGLERGELGRVLVNLPCRFVAQLVRSVVFAAAAWQELVLRRPLTVFQKGH